MIDETSVIQTWKDPATALAAVVLFGGALLKGTFRLSRELEQEKAERAREVAALQVIIDEKTAELVEARTIIREMMQTNARAIVVAARTVDRAKSEAGAIPPPALPEGAEP